MPLWRRSSGEVPSLDEFVGDGEGRSASPLELSAAAKDWAARVARLGKGPAPRAAAELALPAFSLIRGGDLFERPREKRPPRTPPELLDAWRDERLRVRPNKVARPEVDAALAGVAAVLAGNPALCRRLLLCKPIEVVLVPKGQDFRSFGFPPSTNPHAAGVFWTEPAGEVALLGLREEHVLPRPWLMVHEMTHAVHLLAFTAREREDLEKMLMPVYRSRRWVEEALAIYAERAFGADYREEDLRAPGLYGKTRRDWHPEHVFSLFVAELFKPGPRAR